MADSILRLQVESQEYDAKLKRATEGLQRYVDGCRKVGGTLEVVEKDTLEYVKAIGQMETVSRSATGKLSEMKKAFTELSMQYKQMTDAERQSPMGKALSQSLDQLNGRIAETKRQMDDISRDMNGGGGLGGALDALAGKFGVNINQLAGWGAAIAAAAGSAKIMKDAFFASEQNLDDWNRTVYSAQSTYEAFLTSLNTGDVSGFLNNIDVIIGAARDAYNAIDRLQTMQNIQSPKMSAKMAEVQRMETMLRTGRYIAPVDGRKPAMAEGTILTDAQKKRIADNLASAMREIASLTKNEVKASTDAINALYREQALRLGMSNKQFMEGTKSMAAFEANLEKARKYQEFEAAHTVLKQKYNPTLGDYTTQMVRDNAVNPYEKYKGWAVFKDDGELYQQIIQMISQRSASESGYYGQLARAYRGINRAEGVSPYGGGTSGSGKTTTLTEKELTIQQQISKLETEAYTATEERRQEIAKLIQQLDKELEKQKAIRDELHGIRQETVEIIQGTNIQTAAGMGSYLSLLKEQQGKAQYGSAEYNALNAQIVDVNTLNNLMKESVIAGVDSGIFDAADILGADFWTRAMEGGVENIDWQSIVNKINEKRKEAGFDAIKLDFVTGNVSIDKGNESGAKQTTEKHENQIGKVVSGMTSITNSLQHIGVEIPEGFNKVINIMNIIQTIMTTVGSFGSAGSFLSGIPLIGGFFSLFGLANGGVVHAANGFSGIVPGNLMSGDQVPALLNSGEVVLNRAQAGVLASDIRQGSIGYEGRTQAIIESDQIKLVLRNGAQARGMTLSDYLEL